MKKWEVTMSEPAEIDLDGIYSYIADTLSAPDTARRQIQRIREVVLKLDKMPLRGTLFQNEPWRTKGLRWLNVDNYLIIYEIQEASGIVVVVAIMYSMRNVDDVLNDDSV